MTALVSIVIPVRNEHENIGRCLDGLHEGMGGVAHEILICYDSDEDTTLTAIESHPRKFDTLRFVKNTIGPGPSCAIRAGFRDARGDAIVVTMADLSDPPSAIPLMAEKIRGGADIVAGSRYMRGGRQLGGPPIKTLLSRLAGLSLHFIVGLGTHDATTSFRAFSPRLLRGIEIESKTGFTLGLEATVKAHLGGYVVDELPVTWTDRTAGTSNFRVAKWLGAYLHWYFVAVREPSVVWAVWLAVVGEAVATGGGPIAVVAPLASVAGILAARRARGRMTLIDALCPAGWLTFGLMRVRGESALGLVIAVVASAIAIGAAVSTGSARRKRLLA